MHGTVVNVVAASCAGNMTGSLGGHKTVKDVCWHGYVATAIRRRHRWLIRLANGFRPAPLPGSVSAGDVGRKKNSDLRPVPNARALGFAYGVRVPAAILMVVAAIFAVVPGIAVHVLRTTMGSMAAGISNTPGPEVVKAL